MRVYQKSLSLFQRIVRYCTCPCSLLNLITSKTSEAIKLTPPLFFPQTLYNYVNDRSVIPDQVYDAIDQVTSS